MKVFKLLFVIVMITFSFLAFAAGEVQSPDRLPLIMGVLFALSELLASFSKVNANSIFQLIKSLISTIYNSLKLK